MLSRAWRPRGLGIALLAALTSGLLLSPTPARAEADARSIETTGWTTAQQGMPDLWGSAFGASTYVLVGDFGEIWTSPDGTTWTRRTNPDPNRQDLRGLTYGGGQFVAVVGGCFSCAQGTVLRSPDGVAWTLQGVPEATFLYGVTYGGGQYVAVGPGGRVITSPDAIAWTQRTSNTTQTLNGVTFGGGLYVAVGDSHEVVTSPDGVTWTVQTAGVPASVGNLHGVAYAGGVFVAVGDGGIITSPDASTWTPTLMTSSFWAVTHTGSLFVAVSFGPLLPGFHAPATSLNGTTWTESPVTVPPGLNSSFFTVSSGASGVVGAGYSGMIFNSLDGATPWSSQTLATSRGFLGAASDGSVFCVVGGGNAVARSADGLSWTNDQGTSTGFWFSMARGNGVYAAVGGASAGGGGGLMSSPDCVVWTDVTIAPPSGFDAYRLGQIAFGGGRFVAVGDKQPTSGTPSRLPLLLTSPDGSVWTEADPGLPTSAQGHLWTVGWGNGLWVAAGVNDDTGTVYVATSSDGINWTPQSPTGFFPYASPQGLAYGNGVFVIAGSTQGVGLWSSPDGIAWTERQSGTFFEVAYAANQFVAVGPRGTVYSSPDGITWSPETPSTTFHLRGVTYSASLDRFVAVGPSVITYAGGGLPALSIGDAYVVEGSTGSTMCSFDVTLSWLGNQAVTVNYQTADGSATQGSDYTSSTGTLTIAPGVTATTLGVPVNPDTAIETDEDFVVDLSSPSGAGLADAQATCLISDDDAPPPSQNEAGEGSEGTYSLGAVGGIPAVNYFLIGQKPRSSYEIVVDGATADIVPLIVERLAADNTTVLQTATPIAAGSSLSLRWRNDLPVPIVNQSIAIRSGGCTTTCDASDVYHFRSYETTGTLARYNNSATQITVVVLQNGADHPVAGTLWFWNTAGYLVDSSSFNLAAHGILNLNTSTVVVGSSGTITVSNDGRYGDLSGKAVAIEPATGFTFDTPLLARSK